MNEYKLALLHWIPLKLFTEGNEILCQWLYVGDKQFTEPFFDETILHCRQLKKNVHVYKCVSSLDVLPAWAENLDAVAPTAFIFHVSRCGSTLLSQLLALNADNLVLSEVPFLDELLRLRFKNTKNIKEETNENINRYFKAALAFYGKRNAHDQTKMFIKTDSWHLLFYKQIRELYPQALFILLYRSPAEIIRSQKKLRGMQSIPGVIETELFGFGKEDITYDLDVYMSRVLEKYFTKLLEIIVKDNFCILVNYQEGIPAIMNRIMHLTGLSPKSEDLAKIEERIRFDAKNPSRIFINEPDETITPPYLQNCIALYNDLEEKRLSLKQPVIKSANF